MDDDLRRGDLIRETNTRRGRVGVVISDHRGNRGHLTVRWFDPQLARDEVLDPPEVELIARNAVTVYSARRGEGGAGLRAEGEPDPARDQV